MKLTIALCAVCLLMLSCNNGGSASSTTNTQTYEERVMSVEEMERADPVKFLEADGTYKENFWGDKLKVSCTITNSATVVTFKDAVVRVTYYSKTKTVLGTNDYTVYEFFAPNSSKTVELKVDNYTDVNSIGWEVVDAKAE